MPQIAPTVPGRIVESLQTRWHVSISKSDAQRAAMGIPWEPCDLELGGDPENHPQLIDLPGGWHVGLRPRDKSVGTQTEAAAETQHFVGHVGGTPSSGKRLPHPWLTYAKRVMIPDAIAGAWGQTVFLHLDNVRYHVTVSVNDQQVAQYVGGLEPHRIDITHAVSPGKEALILITVEIGRAHV